VRFQLCIEALIGHTISGQRDLSKEYFGGSAMIELLLRATENATKTLNQELQVIAKNMESRHDNLCVVDFDGVNQDWYLDDELIVRLLCDLSESIILRKKNQTIPVECTLSRDNKRLYEGEAAECVRKLAEVIEGELDAA
jgi:hypothetical protein